MIKKFFILLFLLLPYLVSAQSEVNKFTLSLNGVFTTSAKIFLNPNSSDALLRNSNFVIQNFLSPQAELKYNIYEDIYIGLSSEYMKTTSTGDNLTLFAGNRTVTIPVEDGFLLIPIEFTGYYKLPFSTENFHFYMGGGAGYYFGSHIRKFGDAEVSNAGRKFAYGIHVSISMDYYFKKNLSLHSEMKFRDPQFRVTSRYNKTSVNYKGSVLTLAQDTFDSKVNVDGISFILGVAFHF